MPKKKEKDLFKEDFLDGTKDFDVVEDPKFTELDLEDPMELKLDLDDPLNTEFELETSEGLGVDTQEESTEIEEVVAKKHFGFGKKKKEELEPELNDIEEIDEDLSLVDIEQFYDDSLSIEELEQRERIRQRQELARAEMQKKKADRRAFLDSFRNLGTVGTFIGWVIVSTGYLYWITNLLIPSILISFVGSYFLTFWFYYKKRVADKEQEEFSDLVNIASQIDFNMQNGKNVADTLDYIKDDYEGRVKTDLNYSYAKLMADGDLVTSNFEKYGFTSFDIFLRNLQIAYHDGVDPKRLFKFPLSNIKYEAIQRDSLVRKNKDLKRAELITLAVGIFIPTSLRMFAGEVYGAYLGYPFVTLLGGAIIYFTYILIATHIQKLALDVNVSV